MRRFLVAAIAAVAAPRRAADPRSILRPRSTSDPGARACRGRSSYSDTGNSFWSRRVSAVYPARLLSDARGGRLSRRLTRGRVNRVSDRIGAQHARPLARCSPLRCVCGRTAVSGNLRYDPAPSGRRVPQRERRSKIHASVLPAVSTDPISRRRWKQPSLCRALQNLRRPVPHDEFPL